MDSNEEYLDQLLKSLTEGDSSGTTGETDDLGQDDGLGHLLNQFSDDMENVPGDLLNGLLGSQENSSEELPDVKQEDEAKEETAAFSDMLQDMAEEEPEKMSGELPEEPDAPGDSSLDESAGDIMIQPSVLEGSGQTVPEMPEVSVSDSGTDDAFIPVSDSGTDDALIPKTDISSAEGMEADDLGSLLKSLGADGDEDAREISDLLDRAEHDEPINDVVDSLMQGLNQEVPQNEGYSGDDFLREDAIDELLGSQGKKKKKEKKPRRGKKNKELQETAADLSEDNAEVSQEMGDAPAEGGKKQGFWGKLLNALTQEEEDEEDPAELVSDENEEILKELDKEKKQAKGKKKKKGKDKKAAEADEDEDLEDASDGRQKKKKEKKPKKEKPPVPAEVLPPGKKLSLKRVIPLVAVFLVLCLAFVMVSHLYINHVNKQQAEDAYYAGDYMECYSLFFGQELNESQELMFHRSELILQMERMKGNYRRLVTEGKELEALDYLVQCICRREDSYLQGQEWNSLDVVEEAYSGMMGLLTANYGLTEERAKEIAALKKDADYTIALLQVLEGTGSGALGEESGQQGQPVSYEDLLPEEEEDSGGEFVDTLG